MSMTQADREEKVTWEAMMKAAQAFRKRLEKEGYDPAYWDFRITVWWVDAEFTTRYKKFEYEDEYKGE